MSEPEPLDTIVDAALKLAAERPWAEVGLSDISREAGMTLAGLASHVAGKTDILKAFSRRIDRALLVSVESDPLEGDPHDRLFDAMFRRIELLGPYKTSIAGIARSPAQGPAEWLSLLDSAVESQGWILAAAGLEGGGLRTLCLATVQARVLRVWLTDDDAGLARTMAALDRALRDGEAWAKRLEVPLATISGICKAWRAARHPEPRDKPKDEASHASAD